MFTFLEKVALFITSELKNNILPLEQSKTKSFLLGDTKEITITLYPSPPIS